MKVQVNQNIDSYKDDFFKGLTFRQTAVSVIGVAVGAGIFLVLTRIAHLNQTIAVYILFPVVFPIIASGFLKVHGMDLKMYFLQRMRMQKMKALYYAPEILSTGEGEAGMKQERPSATGEVLLEDLTSIKDLEDFTRKRMEDMRIEINEGLQETE
jgi:hypothetical protein